MEWDRAPSIVRDNWRMLAGIALLLGVWRISILALSLVWWRIGITNPWPEEFAGMRIWRFSIRHDAEWYLGIVRNGYEHTPGEPSSVAFFPGLPVFTSLADRVLPSGDVFAGLVIVHLALVAALIYVFLIVRLDFNERVAWWTLGFMLMFPAGFYFSAIYPQSLLLLGIAGALYHARRGQWWMAGGFGFLAGVTGLAGMLVVIPLVLELRRSGERRLLAPWCMIAVALAPLGGLTYFAYLWSEFGSPRVFIDSLKAWDTGSSSALLWNGLDYLRGETSPMMDMGGRDAALRDIFVIVDLTLIFGFLLAGVLLWWKVRASYGVLVIVMTLLPLLVGSRLAMGSQVVVLFPVFMLLARIPYEGVRMGLSIIFTLGLGLTAFLFVQGFWAG